MPAEKNPLHTEMRVKWRRLGTRGDRIWKSGGEVISRWRAHPPPISQQAATVGWRAQCRWGPAGGRQADGGARPRQARSGGRAGGVALAAHGGPETPAEHGGALAPGPRRGGGGARRPGNPIFPVPSSLRACARGRLAVRLGKTPERPRQRRFPARREPVCRSVDVRYSLGIVTFFFSPPFLFIIALNGRFVFAWVMRCRDLFCPYDKYRGGGKITCVDTGDRCCTSVLAACFGSRVIFITFDSYFCPFVCA